ncbi:MAG: TrkA family potassium uptake protein [Polyangiaceae bacterium]
MASPPEHPVRLLGSVALLGGVILAGGLALYLLGGGRWSFGETVYIAENAVSTAGFRELEGMDQVRYSRLASGLIILLGLGTTAYFQSTLTAFLVQGVLGQRWRIRRMKKQIEELTDHVLIAGGGSTGMHSISELTAAQMPFVVIDTNHKRMEHLSRELCDGRMLFVVGDATDDTVLLEAGITRASAVIAALTEDKDNLFVTLSARSLNPTARIVAKVIASDAVPKMMRAGANATVSPNMIGGRRMASEIMRPTVVEFIDQMLHDRTEDLRLEEVVIPEGSTFVGKTLREAPIRAETNLLVVALRIEGKFVYNPEPSTELDVGCVLVVIGPQENVGRLRSLVKHGRSHD